MLTRIQSRVRPIPIKPPDFVKNVAPSILNLERVTSTVLSKSISNTLSEYGYDLKDLVVYLVLVQGFLHPKSMSLEYRSRNKLEISLLLSIEKLYFMLHVLLRFSER